MSAGPYFTGPYANRGLVGITAGLAAAGTAALTDKIPNVTAAGVAQTWTPTVLFALLDDQAMTWTANQGISKASPVFTLTDPATATGTVRFTGTTDTGTNAVGTFDANLAGGALATRPAFNWTIDDTAHAQMRADGSMIFSPSVSSTSFTTDWQVGVRFAPTGAMSSTAGVVSVNATAYAASSASINAGVWGIARSETAQNLTSTAGGLAGLIASADHTQASTVTAATGLLVRAMTNSGGGTITTTYGAYLTAQTVGTTNYGVYALGNTNISHFTGSIAMGATSPTNSRLHVQKSTADTAGSVGLLRLVPTADTGQTASTEISAFHLATQTRTWATGNFAKQREALFKAQTYAFAGASTITDAATVAIDGAPIAGTNATFTNAYALWVESGKTKLAGACDIDGVLTLGAQVNLKSYTVATLPSAATAGGFIYVSDETGGAIPCFSDATNWRRVSDRTIAA